MVEVNMVWLSEFNLIQRTATKVSHQVKSAVSEFFFLS